MARAAEIENLDCQDGIVQSALRVLATRFDEMWALRAAALRWEEIEGVHDMRVASRRLRGALQDFSPFLGALKIKGLRRHLRALARALGEVRDRDVAIAALAEFRREAPPEIEPGLARILSGRQAEREAFREALAARLSEEERERSYALFRQAVDSLDFTAEDAFGQVSFREAGRRVITRRVKELHDLSPSLYRPFEVEPLHQLRIAAKRLRYAVELFSLCWGKSLRPAAGEIASLQASLGEVHDCDEWIARLGAELSAREQRETAERFAAAWLMGRYSRRRAKHYGAALAQWHEWERTDFFRRLFDLLKAAPRPGRVEDPEKGRAVVLTAESREESHRTTGLNGGELSEARARP